jgi:hypothetical protein
VIVKTLSSILWVLAFIVLFHLLFLGLIWLFNRESIYFVFLIFPLAIASGFGLLFGFGTTRLNDKKVLERFLYSSSVSLVWTLIMTIALGFSVSTYAQFGIDILILAVELTIVLSLALCLEWIGRIAIVSFPVSESQPYSTFLDSAIVLLASVLVLLSTVYFLL